MEGSMDLSLPLRFIAICGAFAFVGAIMLLY